MAASGCRGGVRVPGFAQLAAELTQTGQPGCEGCGHPSLYHKPPNVMDNSYIYSSFCSQTCSLGRALCGLLLCCVQCQLGRLEGVWGEGDLMAGLQDLLEAGSLPWLLGDAGSSYDPVRFCQLPLLWVFPMAAWAPTQHGSRVLGVQVEMDSILMV